MQKVGEVKEAYDKIKDGFDLSNAQKRTIITEISKPGNEAYIVSFKVKFALDDEEYVKKALHKLICGNLLLRMKKDEDMNFMQYYADEKDTFLYLDMQGESEDEINDYIFQFSRKPFNEIFNAPLYQFMLLKTDKESIVVGRAHHLIMDGTSVNIFAKNLQNYVNAFKNGEKYSISTVSYEEYVKKEKEYLSSNEAKEDEKFWLSNLKGYYSDWYSSDDISISRNYFYLDTHLTEKLKNLSSVNDVRISPFLLALSAVSLYFAKSTCSEEMVWNSVYHGRDFGKEFYDMMGMFVNMMPLKLEYDKEKTFEEVLLYTKSVLKNGLTHGKLSFNVYGAKLQQEGIDPAMLSMYSMVSNSTDSDLEYLINHSKSEFPLHIRVNPALSDKDGLQLLLIEYNKDCFSDDQIQHMVENIQKLLYDIADNPDKTGDKFEIGSSEFYEAEKYFKEMMRKTDVATTISSDINGKEEDGSLKNSSISLNKPNIERFCRENEINPNSVFLLATLFALSKFVFSKDILISIISNNFHIGQELPFGLNIDTDKSVSDYLKNIHNHLIEVLDYDYYPFTKIKSKNYILPEFLYVYGINGSINEKSLKPPKISVFIQDTDNEFKIISHYNDAVYSKDLIETFTESINLIIHKLIKDPDALLKDISILEEDNKEEEFKISPIEEPLLNKLFEKQVEESKSEIALIAEDGEFTYDELNRKANRIANALIKHEVQVEDRIMFILKRDSRLIATILGIIKAGCAFIPIDPEYPEERIKQVLEDSDAKYIITKENFPNALDIEYLLLEDNEENPNPNLTPYNLCFLIYTSGSTGKPKGVMLTHSGITNYLSPNPENIPIHALVTKAHKMVSISTVSFIVFMREIFGTLTNGLPVIFANEEESINPLKFAHLFEKTGADAFGSTPTRLLQYLEVEEVQKIMEKCKVIVIGGETFPPKLYNILSKYTDAEIYNSYGPTEITIASHGKLITSDDISAGEPLLNVIDRIMDIDGNPLPYNVVGELYVAGKGVARGYWNNEELTKERFITYNGLRYYNTGDLVKRNNSGELYVLGRMDNQIKLRGLRIELGEIENTISEYDGIKSVHVLIKEVQKTEHLCTYFTAGEEIDIADLRNNIANKLPAYMVPSYFIRMDSFPVTPNGKTDLKNLPHPEIDNYELHEIIAPETDLEKDVFNMCAEILDTTDFGVTTDLFHLGLTSLSVLKLVGKISHELGVNVNVTNIMRARNIREITKEVSSSAIVEEKLYEKQEIYPLTQNQLGVYFDCVKNPEKLTYNLPKIIRFRNDINPEKLKNTLLEVIDKHPYMKTGFVMKDGEIYQKRRDSLKVNIEIKEGIIDRDIINNFIKPFALYDEPLIRFEIYKNLGQICLLADFHHIILDGTSLNIFFNELGKLYDGKIINKEKYNGFDLSLEELEVENSPLYNEAEAYFENIIPNYDNVTVISPDLNGKEEYGQLGEIKIPLDKNEIEEFCKNNAITPNNLFLAATVFTLSKFVYDKDILISTISNGRSNPRFQNTLAMMVKTLPIALNINSDLKASEYFNYVENIWLDVLKYDCYPFTKISDKYDMFPDFLYAYHGRIIEDIKINGHLIERESLEYEALKFKLSVNVVDIGESFNIFSQYNDALYSEDLIKTFVNSIKIVINKLIENNEVQLKDISIITEEDISEFKIKPVAEQLLNKVFEKQVEESKSEIALIAEDGGFTYDELNRKANRIANALIKHGVKPEDRIMFILKRDSRLIATILGIIKAGCAFIPVDPEFPKERIKYVLEDSKAKYIITKGDLPDSLNIDELLLEENEENPDPELTPDNLCYLIYTSGSTGKPKGVMLTHSNITNYVYPDPKNCYAYGFMDKASKIISIATVSFDLFLHEAFIPLMNGSTLIFANDEEANNPLELIKLFKKTNADSFSATPSRMLQYLEFEGIRDALSECSVITVAGEKYPLQLHKMLSSCTDADIYNVYGPTEITISCNTKHVTDDNITVGKPLLNVKALVMDMDNNPLPPCVVGELYIAGAGVSRGYWNKKELTDDRFVIINDLRYYKTGDFAKKEKMESTQF